MRGLFLVAFVSTCAVTSGAALAGVENCATKTAALERKIEYARLYGNRHQLAGLERALSEVKANCTGSGQLERAEKNVREKRQDVEEARQDVIEARQELAEAQSRGDAGKIAKRQRKLAEKQQELEEKQAELRQAEDDLTALKK